MCQTRDSKPDDIINSRRVNGTFWLHLEDDGASSRLVDWGTIKAVTDMCLFEAKSSVGAEVNLEE